MMMSEEEILQLAEKVKKEEANVEERSQLLGEMNKIISEIEKTLPPRSI